MRRPHDFPEREARMISYIPGLDRPGSDILQVLGIGDVKLPAVTIETALKVPAVAAAVSFLPSTLAALPLHAFRDKGEGGAEKIAGGLQRLLNDAPNPEWTSYGWRKYHWQQVFTGGRGLAGSSARAPTSSASGRWTRRRPRCAASAGRKSTPSATRPYGGRRRHRHPFPAEEDQLHVRGPGQARGPALRWLDMDAYARGFFRGGGVPPLALTGPMPAGPDAIKRGHGRRRHRDRRRPQVRQAGVPDAAGYKLKPVGFDPAKGQMTEARPGHRGDRPPATTCRRCSSAT
jgi:hypothetical protein